MNFNSVFDPADISGTDTIGGYNIGKGGAVVDSQTINSLEWLNAATALFAGDGATAISATGTSLDVNVTNTVPVTLAKSTTYLVTKAPVANIGAALLSAGQLAGRCEVIIQNRSLGNKNSKGPFLVNLIADTATDGFLLPVGTNTRLSIGPAIDLIVKTDAVGSNGDVFVLET